MNGEKNYYLINTPLILLKCKKMQKMGVSDRRQHQTGMEAAMTIAGLPEGSSPTLATGSGGLQPTTTIRMETVRECEDQANGWDAHSHEVTASREPPTRRTNWWHSPLYDGCAAALALVLSNALSSIYKKDCRRRESKPRHKSAPCTTRPQMQMKVRR